MNAQIPPQTAPVPFLDTSVNAALARLATFAAPTRAQSAAGARHRTELEKKLSATFGSARLMATGSNRNSTGVRGHSDEDYFVVLPRSALRRDSAQSLTELADVIRERFPRTAVRVNRPCVRVPFGDGDETIEITPVAANGWTMLGYPQFLIPNGDGGWMFSAPESHNGFVQAIDGRHAGAVRLLIVLAKLWKYTQGVPISSFYIEITMAAYASTLPQIDLALDLKIWARQLLDMGLPIIFDPRFPYDGLTISPCRTEAQRQEALGRLQTFVGRAQSALQVEQELKVEGALEGWAMAIAGAQPK